MKYSDIKQYTAIGSYQVNMRLDYFVGWIEKQQELNLQLNPDFQRGHVWNLGQQISYIEYLLRGGRGSSIFYFNHPNWMGSFEGDFVCIDGLQRITAIQRFMRNEIPAFGTLFEDYEDKDMIRKSIDVVVNINNLKTRAEVLTWYIEINAGGVVHTEEEINKVRKLLEDEVVKYHGDCPK